MLIASMGIQPISLNIIAKDLDINNRMECCHEMTGTQA